ncbi:MAG TPA: OFA family MFS transporter [Methylocella sp.]
MSRTAGVDAVAAAASGGILDRERIVAKAGFNRWLVPPAALAIHLCIGMAYGFSVFWLPLSHAVGTAAGAKVAACAGAATTFWDKTLGTLTALTATNCEWTQFDLGWTFTLFFVLLGSSAATWGGWLERAGPRKAGVYAALCWCGGLMISALGVRTHQLWMLWIGSGVIGGIGLGLGYISPVSTLIKWFPDRRGMATGMAIMGFGGGAMIGSPLANLLMNYFKTPTSVGVWQTFVVLGLGYFVYMTAGAFGYRVPPDGWSPDGWVPPAMQKAMITANHVALDHAHKTPQFWLIWGVLCFNVSAGIGIIGAASPMLQETFGGELFRDPSVGFTQFSDAQKTLAAAIGGGFVGLFSLFNIGGRFFWATLSDSVGRKTTYFVFFMLGVLCYAIAPTLAGLKAMAVFAAACCIIASMYGGGFATVPAYLADIFGTRYVGAIHGRLLTAWSTAGIAGPVIVNYLHDTRVAEGVPRDHVYDQIFYVLACLLVAGIICNALIRPVHTKWHIEEEAGITSAARGQALGVKRAYGIGPGGLDAKVLVAWALVGLPLAWGVWKTLENAAKIFQ